MSGFAITKREYMISQRLKKSGSFFSLRTERVSTSSRLFVVQTLIPFIGDCKIAMSALIAGTMITLPGLCSGQDNNGSNQPQPPHFPGQAPGEKQAVLRMINGSVSAVDLKTMTLTIKTAEGDRAFIVTSRTKITRDNKAASLSDAIVGKPAEVVIKLGRGQPDEVVTVNLKTE
jgi:hypothetical protein